MMALASRSLLVITVLLTFNDLLATTPPSSVYYGICDVPNNTVRLYPSMSPFYISSHTYNNGTYENNERCTLAMTTSWQPVVLTFNYTSFDLEYHSACSYDYLCVYGVKYCGSWLTGETFTYIVQPFSSFTVVFRTDASVVLGGFKILVTAERATDQRITIADGGVGSNPQSFNYATVTYSPEYQYTDKCVSAATTAGPGTTTGRPDFQTTSPLERGTTTSQEVHYFCNDFQSNVVNINAGSAPLLIFSPYYWRGYYNDNTFCSLVLKSGPEALIVSLNYTQFGLEKVGGCFYDYLCVHGIIFCGNWLAGDIYQYILPANSELTLVFKTDTSVVMRGFEIQVSQERAINQSITEAVGGVGDFNQNVVYKNLTFPTNEPYKDECAQLFTTNSPGAGTTAAYTSNGRTTRSSAAYTSYDRTTSASCLTNVNEIRAEINRAFQLLNRVQALLRSNTDN
jgi:hypothetical protein